MNLFLKIGSKVRINAAALVGIVPLTVLNGLECTALLLLAAALHEAAHLCAVCTGGGKIKRVDIGFLGAEIVYGGENMSLFSETVNSFAGIIINAAFACFSYAVYIRSSDIRFAFFSLCNVVLSAVNLMPVKGLDGFNALYYYLQTKYDANKAYTVCCFVSSAAGALLAFAALLAVINTGFNTSVLLLFMTFAVMRKNSRQC